MEEFKTWRSFGLFVKAIRYKNRYLFDDETQHFLDTLIQTRSKRIIYIKKDTIFWRAQIGCKLSAKYRDGKHDYDVQRPYTFERMKPLPDQAIAGRANPAGIPFLYLATEQDTALAEVRPWLGSEISLAKLKVIKDLSLINISTNQETNKSLHLDEPIPEIREQIVWSKIDNAFSKPISSQDNSTDYVPTQIISELFKNHGDDGIVYKSKLGKGLNVVLFDIESAEVISCDLYSLDSMNFSFSKISQGKIPTLLLRNSEM
jgi:hypothetical protein